MTELLDSYRLAIEARVESWLRPYLERCASLQTQSGRPKEFNDPIWGTLLVHAHEVVIIDSPLLQRLRRIRQLGVAHLVYPAGGHSRFEHSLGVVHQVQRLSDSINLHAKDKHRGADHLGSEDIRLLRLAALCHDVGHGLMSHVVENALRLDGVCQQLVNDLKSHLERDTAPQLSEAAAYMMVRSPAFAELCERACLVGGVPVAHEMPTQVAKLIIGQQLSERTPLLHEIITGPFDADKLDYMPRDATMCGVPVVTDVVRLIQKVRAVDVHANDLPDGLSKRVPVNTTCLITGIARSGASTLDELALGRSLMFDKIYRHHKVRAAEAMVGAILMQIGELLENSSPLLPLTLLDDELLDLTPKSIRERVQGASLEGPEGSAEASGDMTLQITIAADICRRLQDRRLFGRAFAFSQQMPYDPYHGDEAHRLAISSFITGTSSAEGRSTFLAEVAGATEYILTLLGKEILLDDLPGGRIRPYLWIDPPAEKVTDNKPDTGRAYLIDEDGRLERTALRNAETRGWAEAYVLTRDIGYVFCPRELTPYVHIAAEVAARRHYDVRLASSMTAYAKQSRSDIREMKLELAGKGFYTGTIRSLAPLPDSARSAARKKSLELLTERLQGYAGPVDPGRVEGHKINRGRIIAWAAQFGTELAEVALDMAEAVLLIDRELTQSAISAFLGGNEDFRTAAICPLGQPKDGSGVLTYYAGDIAQDQGMSIMALSEALSRERSILFVDDLVGRGDSAVSILEALLGLPASTELHEDRPQPLGAAARKALRASQLAFVFCAGLAAGERKLREKLAEMGFTTEPLVYVHVPEEQLPTAELVLSRHPDKAEKFLHGAKTIGKMLLVDGDEKHDDAWRTDRALGYGNFGLLVISAYNTPTATLTAFWKDGEIDGLAWRALFPRRKKI